MKIAQIISADSWGDVTPEALDRGIGGREGALIRLAKEWAKLGHEVTNFVPTQKAARFNGASEPSNQKGEGGFHEYIPLNLAKPMLKSFPYDAVVAWECPSIFNDEAIVEKQKVRLIHMQVAHLHERDFVPLSTGIVALSPWARDFMIGDGVDHKNFYVRPNGVDISMYPIGNIKPSRRKTFVYSSSPDRGLWHLLRLWPKIHDQYRKSILYIAYGVEKFTSQTKWMHSKVGEMSVDIQRMMQFPGVVDLGKIGQKDLAKLQLKASAWLYPADTIQATETGCITAIENMAAGNPCIMTDADCLESEFGGVSDIIPLPFDEDAFLDATFSVLNNPSLYRVRSEAGREFAEKRAWEKIAPTWIDLFKENTNG